jgi:hypothetical protein
MVKRGILGACITLLGMSGCTTHRVPAPLGDASSPRLGWVIMHGSASNPDEEFVCQSNPQNACALPASTAQRRVFSNVHLYFHPTGQPARYEGTLQIGFLGDGRPAKLALAVPAKEVSNDSVVGIVTEKPGEYAIALSATAMTPTGPVTLNERVPVTIK